MSEIDEIISHTNAQSGQPADDNVEYVVGIGASAGGLDSLEEIVRRLTRHSNCLYVIVQHLSPDFKSHLSEILGRWTDLPIVTISHGMRSLGGHIYIAPAGKRVFLHEGTFLVDEQESSGIPLPIDDFFRSVSENAGRRSVAVVVSGTGSDGTRGAAEIANRGGLVIAETPTSAAFDGMPNSLITSGAANLVLHPSAIPGAIDQFVTTAVSANDLGDRLLSDDAESVGPILKLLADQYSVDFSQYKQSTIQRRVQRRLGFKGLANYSDYLEILRSDSDELTQLFDDLLIGVTAFFRDSTVFNLLRKEYLRDLISKLPADREFRAWVVGCASGEEAYSIAMTVHEILEELGRSPNAKLFATDLHVDAIQKASSGVYSPSEVAGISDARLNRYFERTPKGFRVCNDLRQMLIFAPHNCVTDAPFLRLDFISCRNLLIYLQPQTQKRLLSLFHFSLRQQGILLLGSSETLGELADDFETVNAKWKIYRKDRATVDDARYRLQTKLRNAMTLPGPGTPATPVQTDGPILEQFMPKGILIDSNREVVHCYGGAEAFLSLPGGAIPRQISGLVVDSLRASVNLALQRLELDGDSVRVGGGKAIIDDELQHVVIHAARVQSPQTPGWVFLTFEHEKSNPDPSTSSQSSEQDPRTDQVRMLEDELQATRENLQATVEELEASNEELQATNQKLIASNEQLQSTNEELHSVNEELFTVNTDHQRKIAELVEVTEDLNNLLTSTEIGVIFLDRDLRIRKYTDSVKQIFDLVDSDIGRKITSFSDRFGSDSFPEMLSQVRSNGEAVEREVSTESGESYLLRILPYATIAEQPSDELQVVVTIVDITTIKSAEQNQSRLARLIDESDDFIVSTDGNGKVETWNRGAERMIGTSRDDAIGRPLSQLLCERIIERPFESFFESLQEDQYLDIAHWTVKKQDSSVEMMVDWRAAVQRDSVGRVEAVSFIARDISEVAEANRRVAASEHELRRVMESVTEAIVVLDSDWRFIFVNDGMCRMMGLETEQLLGNVIWEIFPETNEDTFQSALREAMSQNQTMRFERFFNATNRWYQCHCFPNEDRLTVFFTDITDLRRNNDLLRQQAEMLELSHDAIIVWDLNGGITFWNRGAELLYGYSREEVLGKSSHEVLGTEHSVSFHDVLQAIREHGDWEGRLIHRTRSGQRLQIASRLQLIKSAVDGNEIVLEINRDMTEYDDLSNRVAQLASIADLTTDFVGTAEANGDILYVNRGAAKLLGYDSPDELRGLSIQDVHPHEVVESLTEKIFPAAARGEVCQFESELLTKTGDRIPISQVVMAHLDSHGVVTHYSTIARDISKRKTYELELETMRDVAESANRAKSAFLARMSHEIRTPMTAILGCSEQLQESAESEEDKQLSRVMVEQGHALMAILDDILDLSRIEAEKIEIQFRPVDLIKVMRDLHRLMTPRAEETGLQFELELEGEFPKRITTDAVRLRQILVNLLSNAFKFTPKGTVRFAARCRRVERGSELQIEVADSGVGIASDDLLKIFEAFSRLQNPNANAAGTGLGLTIAHRLTDRLGGELDVESIAGKGTTFIVRFPIPGPDQVEYLSPQQAMSRSEGQETNSADTAEKKLPIHVLVAEDTDAIRFLLSKILSPAVQKLTIVENGKQAIEQMRNDDSVSMILMDMQMPVLSGLDATKQIREEGYTLPIIALTAGAMDADRTNCIEAGCSEFLSKPINKQRLLTLIEELAETAY